MLGDYSVKSFRPLVEFMGQTVTQLLIYLNTMDRPVCFVVWLHCAGMQVSKPLELQLYPGPKTNSSFTSPGASAGSVNFILVAQSRL